MVGASGFEPPTSWSRTMRAAKLRYAPTLDIIPPGCDGYQPKVLLAESIAGLALAYLPSQLHPVKLYTAYCSYHGFASTADTEKDAYLFNLPWPAIKHAASDSVAE